MDISKCDNESCPISKGCKRFRGMSDFIQTYSNFSPTIKDGAYRCEYFIEYGISPITHGIVEGLKNGKGSEANFKAFIIANIDYACDNDFMELTNGWIRFTDDIPFLEKLSKRIGLSENLDKEGKSYSLFIEKLHLKIEKNA